MKMCLILSLFFTHLASAKFSIKYISEEQIEPIISSRVIDKRKFTLAKKLRPSKNINKKDMRLSKQVFEEKVVIEPVAAPEVKALVMPTIANKDAVPNPKTNTIPTIAKANILPVPIPEPLMEVVFKSIESATLFSTLKSWVGKDVDVIFKDVNWAKNIVIKDEYTFNNDLNSSIKMLLEKLNSNKQMKTNGVVLAFSLNINKLEIIRV